MKITHAILAPLGLALLLAGCGEGTVTSARGKLEAIKPVPRRPSGPRIEPGLEGVIGADRRGWNDNSAHPGWMFAKAMRSSSSGAAARASSMSIFIHPRAVANLLQAMSTPGAVTVATLTNRRASPRSSRANRRYSSGAKVISASACNRSTSAVPSSAPGVETPPAASHASNAMPVSDSIRLVEP